LLRAPGCGRGRSGRLVYLDDHGVYLPRLKGEKRLILGNHDHSRVKHAVGWSTVDHMLAVKVDDVPLVLCHYGMRVWEGSQRGVIHLYGHSHGSLPGDSQSLDVGVDCWDFRLVSLDEIREGLATQPVRSPTLGIPGVSPAW
jgi:calcineurin-like phosphoesterase family protein